MKKSLKQQTEALYQEYKSQVPAEIMNIIDRATEELVETNIGHTCLQTGDRIPTFSLPDAYGQEVRVDELLAKGPLVVSFYRGGWCTFCNLELKALQDHLEDIRSLGAELIAITPQQPDGTRSTLEELNIGYPILTDADNLVAQQFGLVFEVADELKPVYREAFGLDIPKENGNSSYELPVTATYVVDQSRNIVAAFTDPNFVNRFDPSDILAAIPTVQERAS